MVRYRPSLFAFLGVLGWLLAAGAPPVFGAPSPIKVESRSTSLDETGTPDARADEGAQELPFQAPVEQDDNDNISGGETQYEIQLLRQEVQQLRGQVEELQHQLARMKSTQEDRYLELDGRFQNLSKQISGSASISTTGTGRPQPDETSMPEGVPGGDGGKTSGEEKELYESALGMIRNRQYDQAIEMLRQTIDEYPDGEYTPNAYYWLGEVYAAKPEPDYEKARQALAQVISYFPDSRKVPDAAFKLGKVYNLMGDCERAKDILSQVAEQQKGKSVGKLAENYLRDNVKCGQ